MTPREKKCPSDVSPHTDYGRVFAIPEMVVMAVITGPSPSGQETVTTPAGDTVTPRTVVLMLVGHDEDIDRLAKESARWLDLTKGRSYKLHLLFTPIDLVVPGTQTLDELTGDIDFTGLGDSDAS